MASPRSHSFIFPSRAVDHNYIPSTSFNNIPSCPPPLYFHDGVPFMMKRSMSFSEVENTEANDDGLSDDGSALGEKKKRLNLEQVKALEKSFELGNKLEPERKMQLAKALGLQPRQIAIWFQNRRARWKTKQLERDYEVLKKQFDALKADNDVLQSQNTKLHAQLLALKSKDSSEAGGGAASNNGSDNSCDINLEISKTQAISSSSPAVKELFPSAFRSSAAMTQLLHSHKMEAAAHQVIQDDQGFSHMFDEQHAAATGFWPWSSDQNAHFH